MIGTTGGVERGGIPRIVEKDRPALDRWTNLANFVDQEAHAVLSKLGFDGVKFGKHVWRARVGVERFNERGEFSQWQLRERSPKDLLKLEDVSVKGAKLREQRWPVPELRRLRVAFCQRRPVR